MFKKYFWVFYTLACLVFMSVVSGGINAACDHYRCEYHSLWDYNPGRILVCEMVKPRW